ncbi:MAG: presenilin family intramembrane aspartyl protease [Candidatus Micrarchaeaceae archaeon]
MEFRQIGSRQVLQIFTIFLIVQFGGFLLAFAGGISVSTTHSYAVSSPAQTLWFAVYIILVALIMVLIIKLYKGEIIFRLIEGFVVIAASFFVFLLVLGYFAPNAVLPDSIAALALAVMLVLAKNKKPSLRNTTAVLASIGVGVVLGVSFGFDAAFALFIIIGIYDFVAVFVTKHMITLAKAVSSRNLAFLVSSTDVEAVSRGMFPSSKKVAQYINDVKKSKNPVLNRLIKNGRIPIVSQIQLGAGDLGIPLMMEISTAAYFGSYFLGLAAIVGSASGLLFTMWVLKRYMKPLPAIPPILAFTSFAFAIAFYLKGFGILLPGLFATIAVCFLFLIIFGAKRMGKAV